ncbi:MAG: hypothetical protein NUW37_03385 [Planctomycetes bacterium]|nr:hypothetical protein [Planctomycetota bacterium]
MKRFKESELVDFREKLLQKRSEILGDVEKLEEEALKESEQDNTGDAVGDHATDNFEQGLSLGLLESEAETLRKIDSALKRLDNGSFGVCVDCAAVPLNECPTCPLIAEGRLRHIPWAERCVQRQEVFEREFERESE